MKYIREKQKKQAKENIYKLRIAKKNKVKKFLKVKKPCYLMKTTKIKIKL